MVLPFANLSGDPAQDYLADALTDELTTSIARNHSTFVIARNTAFTYKVRAVDAKGIGKELGVRYVLEGSVLPTGNQVRVNAQLIDADSGAHLWAEQFDTPRADLLQTQDEIVTHLAYALQFQLSEAEAARLKRTPAANPDAEDLALQCIAAVRKAPEAVSKEAQAGFRLCEQALTLAPDNVHALAVLSVRYWQPVSHHLSVDPKADLNLEAGLVKEVRARKDAPLWRRDEETERPFALKLTAAGLKAIASVSPDDVGRHAPTAAPRDGSKLALMIDLLRRADGATIVDLTQATGWLAHTTRAAITGLRKRGYAVIRERIGAGESVYRISGAPDGCGDRVAVQTEAVDGRRDPKPKTKRAA